MPPRTTGSPIPARTALLGFAGMAIAVVGVLAGCTRSLPPGTRACVGLPAEVCQREVADLEQEGTAHGGVAAYRLECTAGPCTADHGEGTLTVVFGDGTGREGGFGYAVPVGTPPSGTEPPLPVPPVCVGIPASWCEDFARTAAGDATREGQTVIAITVRCTTTCTETNGDGKTRITLADGTIVTTNWGYRG